MSSFQNTVDELSFFRGVAGYFRGGSYFLGDGYFRVASKC